MPQVNVKLKVKVPGLDQDIKDNTETFLHAVLKIFNIFQCSSADKCTF